MIETPVETLSFHEMTAEHVVAMAELEALVSPHPWSRALFEGELGVSDASRHWRVVKDGDGRLVAFGGVMFVADDAHLMNVAVHPDLQRRGLGTRLVALLFLEALNRGARSLTLEVRASNTAGRAMYRRFAFTEAGVRPGYYQDGEDAIVMWVHKVQRTAYRQFLTDAAEISSSPLKRRPKPRGRNAFGRRR